MKTIWMSALLGLGLIFGNVAAQAAGQSADAAASVAQQQPAVAVTPIDTLTVPVETAEAAARLRTDSLLQVLNDRVGGVEQSVGLLRGSVMTHRGSGMDDEYIMALLIVAMVAVTLIVIVYITQKFYFRKCEKRYEMERYRLEHGYPVPEKEGLGATALTRRLLITAIIGFALLAWVGVINMSYMGLFAGLLLWVLLAGVGYAIVYLFRVYVSRRDENR